MKQKIGYTLFLGVLSSIFVTASQLDLPIINEYTRVYYATKPEVVVTITVQRANGTGEKAADFFVVNPSGSPEIIPVTVRSLMGKSPFIKDHIELMFKAGADILRITESLSAKDSSGRISSFIGVSKDDFTHQT